MSVNDYQLMFQDYYSGDMITLGGDGSYCSVRFDGIGSAELRTSERDNPAEDGIGFGYEYLGKRNWTINGAVKSGAGSYAGSASGAWDSMSKLMRAWDYNRARLKARDVVPLYFKRPGRETMVVYGRPDRIDPDPTQSYVGYITYQASFRQSDPKFYADEITTEMLTILPPYVGGLLLTASKDALVLPFTTTGFTERQGTINNTGDIDTPIFATINGPVNNPSLKCINVDGSTRWSITLQTNVQSGQSVVVDARQWARSVVRNDGSSLAGAIIGPRLGDLTVPPGTAELVYAGQSPGNTSTCVVNIRNAWTAV